MPAPARRCLALFVSCSAVALIAAPAASAAGCDRVASPAGSDTAAGSAAAPFRSAQKLVDSLTAGQTGCLRAGTYTQNVKVSRGGSASAPVVLRSWPTEKATLVGRLWIAKGANYVTVEHLYLDGRNTNNQSSPTVNAAHTTFRHNDVTNQHTTICFSLGASSVGNDPIWGRATDTLIERNRIHDCGRLPATNQHHGIYVEASDRVVIRDNWIYDNADRGIQLFPDAQSTSITNNVIDSNGQGINIGGDGGFASKNNMIENNLITNSTIRGNVETWWSTGNPVGSALVKRSCVKGGVRDSSNGGIDMSGGGLTLQENLASDPMYVSRAGRNYNLSLASPCRTRYTDAAVDPGPVLTSVVPEPPPPPPPPPPPAAAAAAPARRAPAAPGRHDVAGDDDHERARKRQEHQRLLLILGQRDRSDVRVPPRRRRLERVRQPSRLERPRCWLARIRGSCTRPCGQPRRNSRSPLVDGRCDQGP